MLFRSAASAVRGPACARGGSSQVYMALMLFGHALQDLIIASPPRRPSRTACAHATPRGWQRSPAHPRRARASPLVRAVPRSLRASDATELPRSCRRSRRVDASAAPIKEIPFLVMGIVMVLHAEGSGPTHAARGGGNRPVPSARETKHGLSELVVLAARLGGFEWSSGASSGASAIVVRVLEVGPRMGQRQIWGGARRRRAERSAPRQEEGATLVVAVRRRRTTPLSPPWFVRRPPHCAVQPHSSSSCVQLNLCISRAGDCRSSAAPCGRPREAAHRTAGLAIWLDRSSRRSEEARQRRRDKIGRASCRERV